MSLMAGVVRRRPDAPFPDDIARELRFALSRLQDTRVEVIRGEHNVFLKCDFGAFGAPGVHGTPDGSITLLCGEPLLAPSEGDNRLADLVALHRELQDGHTAILRRACGTFTIAHLDARTTTLTLATDRIGIRPLYVWFDRNYVVFASALRIMEAVRQIPKSIDVRGLTEKAAFGFPLDDRTPYLECKLLRSGELMVAHQGGVSRSLYARWDQVPLSAQTEDARTRAVHDALAEAVRRRRRDGRLELSFLTGGLDSRCIVSQLRQQGAPVYSFCFGLDGSQDVVFAEQIAARVGSIHYRLPIPPSGTAPYPTPAMLPLDAARSQKIWSGDGGSVGLGHVYLTRDMVERMRAGDVAGAITAFCEHNHVRVPARILARSMPRPDETVRGAMEDELRRMRCEDPGRALYLFLLHNDQRRHLGRHFEDLDLHQWEFQLPFLDTELLSTIIATPIEWCLGHHLYNRMLSYFPPATTSVPWQAYPDHEPCPLPIAPELSYQWRDQRANPRHQAVKTHLLLNTRRMLRAPQFPAALLDRKSVRAAYWLTRLGLRDYQYALGTAEIYDSHWRTAQPDISIDRRADAGGRRIGATIPRWP